MVFVSLAGVVACLTGLFLGMHAVMDIGGACAEGGPFVPVRPCHDGVPAVIVGSIWIGLILAGVYAWQVVRFGVPSFLGFLWPALFLSLGWNFLEYGLDPPFGDGPDWGWLVCAVAFFLMGGVPLVYGLRAAFSGGGRSPPRVPTRMREAAMPFGATEWASRRSSRGVDVANAMMFDPDVVSRLERLDALRRSGAIDEAEYETVKDQVLGEGG